MLRDSEEPLPKGVTVNHALEVVSNDHPAQNGLYRWGCSCGTRTYGYTDLAEAVQGWQEHAKPE